MPPKTPAPGGALVKEEESLSSVPSRDGSNLASMEGTQKKGSNYGDAKETPGHKSQPQSRKSMTLQPRTSSSYASRDKDARSPSKSPPPSQNQSVGLDPLSTQIYLRTGSSNNEQSSIAQRLLTVEARMSSDSQRSPIGNGDPAARDRKKVPSFLSRFSMRAPWQREDEYADIDSQLGDLRYPDTPLTPVIGGSGGFMPLHKEPTRYIRVRPHNKKDREFDKLFLAQELRVSKPTTEQENPARSPTVAIGTRLLKGGDAIWATEFSIDGQYLAVAGKDHVLRVLSVISSVEDRLEEEDANAYNDHAVEKLNAPVFRSRPAREFEGHSADVLALSWSKNNFLISSSMDKTVRLWHMSRSECLCTFKHSDLVTSIAFHPTDDRFFLAGCLDGQLRLWNIPDRDVAFIAPTNEFITAVAFSPDGKIAICGLLSGLCMFFETEGFKPLYNIHARSSRGKNAKGSKITGIRTAVDPTDGEIKVLISSNDSRIRVYNLKTKMLEVKFKGLENQSSQIHARFSDDAKYIISGSEDRKAYLWNMHALDIDNKDKQPYESFDAHPEVVTAALLAPVQTRLLLSNSCDPLYELCNPSPVTLRSLDESASQSAASDHHADGNGLNKKPEESPAYQERKKHKAGHILVTADRTGTIKVFRQDCAYQKRQASWETGSRLSGRFASIGRSGSVLTRNSGGSRSRRESLSIGIPTQHSSDMIMNWRQDIPAVGRSIRSASIRTERSMSPMKPNQTPQNTSAASLAVEARRQRYVSNPVSPAGSIRRPSAKPSRESVIAPTLPPRPSFSAVNEADAAQQSERTGNFWNLAAWRNLSGLRYSTTTSNIASDDSTQASAPRNSEFNGGKYYGRRSMGANELSKLKNAERIANGRRSMGPGLRLGTHQEDSTASIDDRLQSDS